MAMLRKKTTDIEKMNKVMKETNEWRKQYTDAIKKHDKVVVRRTKKETGICKQNDDGNATTTNASYA